MNNTVLVVLKLKDASREVSLKKVSEAMIWHKAAHVGDSAFAIQTEESTDEARKTFQRFITKEEGIAVFTLKKPISAWLDKATMDALSVAFGESPK